MEMKMSSACLLCYRIQTPDGVPLYVYNLAAVRDEIASLRLIQSVSRFFYAMKVLLTRKGAMCS